jgi:cyclic beta-1,2-glucan synthetase
LTIAELWAIPQMMRIALIESIQDLAAGGLEEFRDREIADFWANRLIAANRRGHEQLFAIMAQLTEGRKAPNPYFAIQLIDRLYDEEAASAPVRGWLERIYRVPIAELNAKEQNRQTKDQISIGNAITSLKELALLDWRRIFENLSHAELALKKDPAGIYPGMDFATRDRYRRAVEELARRSGRTEEAVVGYAIGLAGRNADADSDKVALRAHVGTYLVGDGREELRKAVGCRESLRYRALQWVYRHHSGAYFAALAFFLALFLLLVASLGLRDLSPPLLALLCVLSLIPLSQLSLEAVNYLVMRSFPPRALSKMDYQESGIPDEFLTLVVVPMMLEDELQIAGEAEKLEIRYLANREDNLLFGLFSDYTDWGEEKRDNDAVLLGKATAAIEVLNERYGSEKFYLFHRKRTWSESERKFIGWERKRGKLEELNRLIAGTRPEGADKLVYVGNPERISSVRFVITLDSDTQLPSGSARRMIETLAHPLNQPRFDKEGRILPGSYSIIQPRVSPSLPSSGATRFSRLFSYAVGIDPYTRAISDVNQDLTGEGSYHGKGIYDARAFSRILSGAFPEGRLLSHDLIEGAYARVALASDIELLDEFPRDYLTFARRQHRWIRGDWQIAAWTFPRVPRAGGGRKPNELSAFNRWKILDNLRRSLVPAASLVLLASSWTASPRIGWIATIVVAAQLLFQTLAQPFTSATTRRGLRGLSGLRLLHDFCRTLVEAALIPREASLATDAILRAWYRQAISHRHLLEWTQAHEKRRGSLASAPAFLASMIPISLLCVGVLSALLRWAPDNAAPALPWLSLWLVSPLLGWMLSGKFRAKATRSRTHPKLPLRDLLYLRKIERRTWRFFSTFVSEESSWLPPDNYQVFHHKGPAMRTSPTNIGLWMLSDLASGDFGYSTLDQIVPTLERSMASIAKLERYKGHLFNWYDIRSLKPLEPRYVSTVDSGNLLGSLWSLQHGLEELVRRPVLSASAFDGMCDTGEAYEEAADREGFPHPEAKAVEELTRACESRPEGLFAQLGLLKRIGSLAEGVSLAVAERPADKGSAYWARQLHQEGDAWLCIRDRYLAWVEILGEKTEDDMVELGEEVVLAMRRDLRQAPALYDLAKGEVECITPLRAARDRASFANHPLGEWLDRLLDAFDVSKWLAGEMLGLAEALIEEVRALSESIDMRFLYDRKRKLFAVGFNVSERRLDDSFYDLLASEARIGSFVAIARGEAPMEHWFAMSRRYNAIGHRRVLLSWAGTMFEYLMPTLLQRSFGGSLLDKAAKDAVAIHVDYGRKLGLPWGVSESAFTDLDLDKNYQYQAFGVPELGLRRDEEDNLIVAPYATLLAIGIAPKKALKNMRSLSSLGLLGEYGYFEAIDFSRQPSRSGGRGETVLTYMAHHQGMGFLALDNFIHDASVQRHFHAEVRARAFESLLYESAPELPPLYHIAARQRVAQSSGFGESAPLESRYDTPDTSRPKTQLLGNGRYSLMITNSGGGYSRWGDFEITRWRSDRTRDPWGAACYIREEDTDRLWSIAYHPADGKLESYSASFAPDRAVFRRFDNGIETETEIVVSSEDDVEIRRITLVNRSLHVRRLELTSYIELAMATHGADLQHPAFNKLFIKTEAAPEHRAIVASRRLRDESEAPIFVAHRLAFDKVEEGELRFETDRRAFIGRGRTLENPAGVFSEPGGHQGFVLDPILSLRATVTLGPGERSRVSLILAAGDSMQAVLDLTDKYGDPHAIDRAMDFAWASAQLELRLLRIQSDDARRFQEMASHLLFPNPLMRPPSERIEENRKGQAGLWTYGVSGDAPIILVSIGEMRDIGLIRQTLQAHAYWRMRGLKADLVILNEEESGYEQPLKEQLEMLIRAHSSSATDEGVGRVFLMNSRKIPREDLALLMAAARIVLVAARGSLAQQTGVEAEAPEAPEFLARKRNPRDSSAPLPFMELPYFNGLGGFTPDGREYAIYLGPGAHTPDPWVNVIANPSFGTIVSETGSGFTWFGNSQRNRLTEWSNDPVVDPPSEVVYIRDEETGSYWTPTASPIREDSAYRARHGAGYTVFEHNSHGIEQELTVFVPVDDSGGQPIKLQKLHLKNGSSRPRTLSVTYYVEWTLGENRDATQMHVSTSWDAEAQALLARNRYNPDYGSRVAFAAIGPIPRSFGGDRGSFIGRNRSLSRPAAMESWGISSRMGAEIDPCAAQRTIIQLEPGEETEIALMLGETGSVKEARALVAAFRNEEAMDACLERTKAWWDKLLGTVEVHTPELAADFLINRWLLYQSLGCRIWGRSATYQSGGAFGFRDQLQDVAAFLYSRPEVAREHILLAASRQFLEGDVQHWWHPPLGTGIRSRISDDMLWLPYVVARYVSITGDKSVLDEEIPFLDAPLLEACQREAFSTPATTMEKATLFEHCKRALARGMTSGPHGLPLIGAGDWNDGLNLVGIEGKGESVWLAWFLVEVLRGMADLSGLVGRKEQKDELEAERKALIERIERSAWDGEWYSRAFFDDGAVFGSASCDEARIDSLPQSWAALSGAADPDHAEKAMESAWRHLVLEKEGLVLLFEPPVDRMEPSPGYIKGYPPGVRENGGQYTHAALWYAIALARRGEGERAAKVLRLLNPIEHSGNPEAAARYMIEPYVIAADIYNLPGRIGQGGWSWYTGSSSWMYRAWVEEVLGLKLQGSAMRIDPSIPGWWGGFSMRYRRGDATYDIRVENPEGIERGVSWIELDGSRIQGETIAMASKPEEHKILVHMGKPSAERGLAPATEGDRG